MKKLVILITVDALRSDICGFSGILKSQTRNLDLLGKHYGTTFTQAFASGVATPMSFPGIMCGLYPTQMNTNKLPSGKLCIADQFRKIGFKTTAILAANPYLTEVQGYNKGFDTFIKIGDTTSKNRLKKNFA